MLNFIKGMINEKLALAESVDPILEETMTSPIDDTIVLGEEGDDLELPQATEEGSDTENQSTDNPEENKDSDIEAETTPEEEPGSGDTPPQSDDTDVLDSPIDAEPAAPASSSTDDILDSPIEDAGPAPEGSHDEMDDILSASIDLKSNTMNDVLPVPPEGANDAIAGDDMETRVDSGFEAENTDPTMESKEETEDKKEDDKKEDTKPTEDKKDDEVKTESANDDILTEAITLGDTPAEGGDVGTDAAPTEEIPAEEPTADASTEPAENSVTAAVRDKVAESELEGGDEKTVGKDELLKKLGSITKSLEDAKKAVMNSIS